MSHLDAAVLVNRRSTGGGRAPSYQIAEGHSRGIRGAFQGHSGPKIGHSAPMSYLEWLKTDDFSMFWSMRAPPSSYCIILRGKHGQRGVGGGVDAHVARNASRLLPALSRNGS